MLEEIVKSSAGLIWKIAKNFYGVDKNDLYQAGVLGVIKAYQNYKDDGITKFSTYAYNYIFGEMYMLANNKEIKLNKNINLIYGKNEAGKTTLLKFISCMFYGISKNKNKKEFSDLEKYTPWKDIDFSGKIKYTLDNKNEYEVFREFNKKNPKIYNNLEDISKTFNIDKTKGNEFFYEQTNIDEESFYSTTLIEQKEVVLDNSEQNILTQKIANLLSTGDENTSFKRTMNLLNKKQVEEVGTARTVGRPINIVNENIDKLTEEKSKVEESQDQKSYLENRQKLINCQLHEKSAEIDLVKKIIKNENEISSQNEKIKINNEFINDEKNKINNLKNKMYENKIEKKQKNKISNFDFYVFFLIIFLINLFLIIFMKNNLIKIIFGLISILFSIIILINKIKINKNIKIKKEEEKKYLLEIKTVENNIEKIQENINKINQEKNNKKIINNNLLKNEFNDKIDENEIIYLLNENLISLDNILEELENNVSALKLQLHTNEIDYNNAIKGAEEKAKIEEKLQGALEEKEELLKLDKSINIAKQAMEQAYEEMKKEITPKFTKNLSNIVDKISAGKYNKIKFVDGEGLIVELENGEYVNANKLSIGTIDQLYLSLRLSAMQEITKEKMPIILDETFAYYDNSRLENILKYIDSDLKENQVIIFTCSNREKDILDKNNIEYNFITI